MNFDEAARFWAYDYCPRGSGGRADHQRQMLTHATVLGRRVCIAIEALPRHRTP